MYTHAAKKFTYMFQLIRASQDWMFSLNLPKIIISNGYMTICMHYYKTV